MRLVCLDRTRIDCEWKYGTLIASYLLGVDETVTIILQYPGKRQAILTCTIMVGMPNQAAICGSTGMIQVIPN